MTVDDPAKLAADLYRPMFRPSSIALVGASDDPSKTGSRPLQYLLESGWKGRIYPVNPRREMVLGVTAWPSMSALPEVPDHAFILTDADLALEAVAACVEVGVAVVTVMASGFAEAGAEGRRRQERLLDIVASSRTRVVGPSSLGVADLETGFLLTANAAFADSAPALGGTFVASQSGSVIGAILSRGSAAGVGFSGLASTGGEADVSLGEICAAALQDPRIESFALFLESLGDTKTLRHFGLQAARQGKPVLAFKLGRTKEAARLSVSHTGALAGDDLVSSQVLADMGIARVTTLDALSEGQALARHLPIGPAGSSTRVGVITSTGGGGAMLVDQLALRDLTVQPPSLETLTALATVGIEVSDSPLIDLTLAGTKAEVMRAALAVLLKAPEFDVVVAVAGSSARGNPETIVGPIAEFADYGTPLAAFVVPEAPKALRMLNEAGVSAFRTPESCADTIAALSSRRQPVDRPPFATPAGPAVQLDEADSYRVLAALGVPHAPFETYDVRDDHPIKPFAENVVVKALSADLAHKSDAGGVILNVGSDADLRRAIARIRSNMERLEPNVRVARCLVQPMVSGIAEALVGYRVDPVAGPIVMLAAGGVNAEVYRDRSLRPAPVDLATAKEMISEVKALVIADGYRGATPGDLRALAEVIVSMSRAIQRPDLEIREAEVNPVMILERGHGVLAVDALVSVASAKA